MNIVMAGASGLIGHLLLAKLETESTITTIDLVGRRAPENLLGNTRVHIAQMEDWPAVIAELKPDIAISTLGTTLRLAGSEEAFSAVDYTANLSFARAAHLAGAEQFLGVSSVGAKANARNFYLSVKGKAERDILSVGFSRVDFFRPGLLRGARNGPLRIGERLGVAVSPLTDRLTPSSFDHYRSIAAADVAGAMMATIGQFSAGAYIHHNREMWALNQTVKDA